MAAGFFGSFRTYCRFAKIPHSTLNLLALWLVMGAGAPALSGQSTNASITGIVSDSSGSPVPHAEVTLTAQATGAQAEFTTAVDGFFNFPNLQAGAYELQVSASGFARY